MNEYWRAFQDMTQSVEQLLTDEHNSLEIRQSATSLKKSVQPCIEEMKQSASRLNRLVLSCSDELYQAENVWLSKPRIAEAAKQEIWEQLGEITGCSFRIRKLASQCRDEALKQAKRFWDEWVEHSRKKWFIDSQGKHKKGIGWSEKESFIREMPPRLNFLFLETNNIIKVHLSRIYKEMANINVELILQYIELLDRQEKVKYNKQVNLIFTSIETKFSKPTEHLPKHVLSLETGISPDVKALVENGWRDIYWEDVVKFKGKVSSRLEKFITAIFDDRVELAAKALTKAIVFYNYFLERQDRYQQETAEQREAEKAWIDQQRRELERVQNGIDAILNTN